MEGTVPGMAGDPAFRPSARAPVSDSPPATPGGGAMGGSCCSLGTSLSSSPGKGDRTVHIGKKNSNDFYFGLGSDCLAHSRSLRHQWASTSPGKGNEPHPFLPLPMMIFFFF